jgi:hypothetical protein
MRLAIAMLMRNAAGGPVTGSAATPEFFRSIKRGGVAQFAVVSLRFPAVAKRNNSSRKKTQRKAGRVFPHFVADAGDDRVGHWLDERIDLARVYAEIWKDAAPAHLVDIAVFCDSDDTHTASISYFTYVRLERR